MIKLEKDFFRRFLI